jgi:hypothetical protein
VPCGSLGRLGAVIGCHTTSRECVARYVFVLTERAVAIAAPPDVSQLTAVTLHNVVVHRIVEGYATVNFGKLPADPLYLLQPRDVLRWTSIFPMGKWCTTIRR